MREANARPGERLRDLVRRTRRSGRRAATPDSRARAASPANGVPLRLPPRITRRPGGYGGERALGRLRVRRLGVVDEADAADLADELEPVRDAGEGAERLRRSPSSGMPAARAAAVGGGGVLAVVRAGDARLRGQRVVGGELDAAAASRHRAEPARDDGDVVRPPGSRRCGASRRGRRRGRRGGRGGRA